MLYVWSLLVCLVIGGSQIKAFMNILRPNPGCGGGRMPCPPQRPCGQNPCPIRWGLPTNCGQGQRPCGPNLQNPPLFPALPYGAQYKATVSTTTQTATETTLPSCIGAAEGICTASCTVGTYTVESPNFTCGTDGALCCLNATNV